MKNYSKNLYNIEKIFGLNKIFVENIKMNQCNNKLNNGEQKKEKCKKNYLNMKWKIKALLIKILFRKKLLRE